MANANSNTSSTPARQRLPKTDTQNLANFERAMSRMLLGDALLAPEQEAFLVNGIERHLGFVKAEITVRRAAAAKTTTPAKG